MHVDRDRDQREMHDPAKNVMNGYPDDSNGSKYDGPEDNRHLRIRSAPHLHSQSHSNSDSARPHPHISHHPNAINRYPFSIPSVSAKLDQHLDQDADGSDALSSLWKVMKT